MPSQSLLGSPLLLVGRDGELGVLHEQLAAALAGHGSLVLTGGEAGIGKTALADALCRDAEAQGALVLTGRCYDLTQTPPYGPWVGVFGQYHRADRLPAPPPAFAHRGTIGAVASQAALFREVTAFVAEFAAVDALTAEERARPDLAAVVEPTTGAGTLVLWVPRVGRLTEAQVRGEAFVADPAARDAQGIVQPAIIDAFSGLGDLYARLGSQRRRCRRTTMRGPGTMRWAILSSPSPSS
jgi:predicted ATPase